MNRLPAFAKRHTLVAAAMCIAALLGGCATTTTTAPDQVVGKRAQQRWDLLLKSDYAKAYEYLSPAQRAVLSPQGYINRFGEGAQWRSAKLDSVSCESAERCTAVVKIETQVLARGFSAPITTRISEIWIQDEGRWWFHQNP